MKKTMRSSWTGLVSRHGRNAIFSAASGLVLAGLPAAAADLASTNAPPNQTPAADAKLSQLSNLSIEQLMQVKVTILGDVNMDGRVTLADQTILEDNFGATALGWTAGDFNHDGTVDWLDYLTLKQFYGRSFGDTVGVPEPATLSLLAFGLAGLLLKRRNRK